MKARRTAALMYLLDKICFSYPGASGRGIAEGGIGLFGCGVLLKYEVPLVSGESRKADISPTNTIR
jgi:hypothetical protein